MIYLDNAATTFPKPRTVTETVLRAVRQYGGNPGRSGHALAVRTSEKIYDVREKIARYFRFPSPEKVVFTYNATYALNIAIKTMIPKGAHVLISDFEHNAVYRPIRKMAKDGKITFDVFDTTGDLAGNVEKLLRPETKAVVCSLQSNVFGYELPIKELSALKKKYGFLLILDGSQAAGHIPVDLSGVSFDAFCAPGHKGLYGIGGCGFAIYANDAFVTTLIEGGSGAESKNPFMPDYLPEKLEAGTIGVPAILSLGAGIDFLSGYKPEEIALFYRNMTALFSEEIGNDENIVTYPPLGCGILSVNLKNHGPEEVAALLSRAGVYVRGGLHCAPLAHKKAGTLQSGGTVRFGFSLLNTEKEIKTAADILRKIAKK